MNSGSDLLLLCITSITSFWRLLPTQKARLPDYYRRSHSPSSHPLTQMATSTLANIVGCGERAGNWSIVSEGVSVRSLHLGFFRRDMLGHRD